MAKAQSKHQDSGLNIFIGAISVFLALVRRPEDNGGGFYADVSGPRLFLLCLGIALAVVGVIAIIARNPWTVRLLHLSRLALAGWLIFVGVTVLAFGGQVKGVRNDPLSNNPYVVIIAGVLVGGMALYDLLRKKIPAIGCGYCTDAGRCYCVRKGLDSAGCPRCGGSGRCNVCGS